VPTATAPTFEAWQATRDQIGLNDPDPARAMQAQRAYLRSAASSDFRYADDMDGYKCPGGAHLRRVNTRDYLDPLNTPGKRNRDATTQLNKRRRILRRGLPYGPDDSAHKDDSTEQGVTMMIIGASLFRQFEFVQQQWIQYGLDFHQGNHTCPMLGDHSLHTRYTIPSDPKSGKPPYIMGGLKTFVETRGGDYFFLPSMTALHMIALGIVDPT
jgi:deferrochelatase/peroxidase EfeB